MLGAVVTPAWAALAPTPRQTPGPFYPWDLPLETDNDLVRVQDQAAALGEAMHLVGRVLDTDGAPVADATVEIWQCDANGRYHHVRDGGRKPLDSGFQGYGRTRAAEDGRYRFRTIRPVPYAGRTPHIHLRVRKGQAERLTTQIYIAGHPRNRHDGLYDPRLAVDVLETQQADAIWEARFDVVVPQAS